MVSQIQKGFYYGYISVDDPNMTFPERTNTVVTAENVEITVVSLRQEKMLFVVHVRMTPLNANEGYTPPLPPGEFLLYNNPTFDTHHHYLGTPLEALLTSTVSRLGNTDTEEGDLFFKLPAHPGHLIFVWLPRDGKDDDSLQYAWGYPQQPCTLFVFCT